MTSSLLSMGGGVSAWMVSATSSQLILNVNGHAALEHEERQAPKITCRAANTTHGRTRYNAAHRSLENSHTLAALSSCSGNTMRQRGSSALASPTHKRIHGPGIQAGIKQHW